MIYYISDFIVGVVCYMTYVIHYTMHHIVTPYILCVRCYAVHVIYVYVYTCVIPYTFIYIYIYIYTHGAIDVMPYIIYTSLYHISETIHYA